MPVRSMLNGLMHLKKLNPDFTQTCTICKRFSRELETFYITDILQNMEGIQEKRV